MELKDNEIEVDVIGKTGVGKTLIQILIADMLTSHGFNVKLRSGDGDDHDSGTHDRSTHQAADVA